MNDLWHRMATHLVTGGCGFVGRNMVKRLYALGARVLFIDDLSVGTHPEHLARSCELNFEHKELQIYAG
jgi:nucleoside-diphosphate-sugar epimerase